MLQHEISGQISLNKRLYINMVGNSCLRVMSMAADFYSIHQFEHNTNNK